jgi:hypothetical protein
MLLQRSKTSKRSPAW